MGTRRKICICNFSLAEKVHLFLISRVFSPPPTWCMFCALPFNCLFARAIKIWNRLVHDAENMCDNFPAKIYTGGIFMAAERLVTLSPFAPFADLTRAMCRHTSQWQMFMQIPISDGFQNVEARIRRNLFAKHAVTAEARPRHKYRAQLSVHRRRDLFLPLSILSRESDNMARSSLCSIIVSRRPTLDGPNRRSLEAACVP